MSSCVKSNWPWTCTFVLLICQLTSSSTSIMPDRLKPPCNSVILSLHQSMWPFSFEYYTDTANLFTNRCQINVNSYVDIRPSWLHKLWLWGIITTHKPISCFRRSETGVRLLACTYVTLSSLRMKSKMYFTENMRLFELRNVTVVHIDNSRITSASWCPTCNDATGFSSLGWTKTGLLAWGGQRHVMPWRRVTE